MSGAGFVRVNGKIMEVLQVDGTLVIFIRSRLLKEQIHTNLNKLKQKQSLIDTNLTLRDLQITIRVSP
jgi:hypothetical protein